jgi:hypothetical protein
MKRVRMVVSLLLLAGTMMLVSPEVASADPGGGSPTYCSAWEQYQEFRHRACVIYERGGTLMGHLTEVQNIGPSLSGIYVGSSWDINGSGGTCSPYRFYGFNAGQVRSFYCSTTRVSGWWYKTTSNVNSSSYTTSPAKQG